MNTITLDQLPHSITIHSVKRRWIRLFAASFFLIPLIFSDTFCAAQQHTLLALSKSDHTLAIVDPVTLKVIAHVPVGSDPHEVIASEDGKTGYVSIYGGGSLHEINVIDLVAHKPLYNIDTRPFMGPHGLTFVGGKLWFTVEGSKCIGRYDPASRKIDWCMGTGQDRTHMVIVTKDLKTVLTSNVSSGTISVIEQGAPGQGRGPGGPGGGPSNETPAHEATESAAREASEKT